MNETVYSGRFLEPNEIARRFGAKPGFQLIDYTEVALPIFVVPIDAIVIASKPLPLVDEFLLRSIVEGIDTLQDLLGFLGLDGSFVTKRLGELVGEDLLSYAPGDDGQARASLTEKGKDALKKVMVVQPKRESFNIAIDGITRRHLANRPRRLLAARDVRAFGLVEIRAFPEDKAPEFPEIAQMDLTAAVSGGSKKEKQIERVMSLVHIGRRLRRYREATMLIFRAERGRQIHVEFFVDGRPSSALNEAFARYDGVKALHIPEQADASIAQTETALVAVLPEFLGSEQSQQATANRPKLQATITAVGNLDSQIEEKELSIDEAGSREEVQALKAEIAKLQDEKAKVEQELNSIETRFVEVHEHRPMFDRSLVEARRRLLIVSPWVRDSVLTSFRLSRLRELVERGVEVFIGYGLGEDDKPGKDKGEQAIRFLEHLADRYANLEFRELGDTHAKILLMDDSYAVVGSFNWLSFAGSSRREFREEMSLRINNKEEIERLFQHYVARFQGKGDGGGDEPSEPGKFTNSLVFPKSPTNSKPDAAASPNPVPKTAAPSHHDQIQTKPLRPSPSKPADPNIITLKQFADELKQPLGKVLQDIKQTFPNLAEGAKVNRSALLQQWRQLTGHSGKETVGPPTVGQATNKWKPEVTKSPLSQQHPSPSRPQPKIPPGPEKSTAPPPLAPKNAQLTKTRHDCQNPVPIRVLANHLGVPVEKIVEDLGWGRLSKADCVVAYAHVVRLCQQYQRPLPGI